MAKTNIKLKIVKAWWAPVFIRTLAILCYYMGTRPDMDKVARIVCYGLKVRPK